MIESGDKVVLVEEGGSFLSFSYALSRSEILTEHHSKRTNPVSHQACQSSVLS